MRSSYVVGQKLWHHHHHPSCWLSHFKQDHVIMQLVIDSIGANNKPILFPESTSYRYVGLRSSQTTP
ncbi:predicted protein [Lichtheimia corymbifera JMRC:FSU:9682]|uniref:Uncharacterized protein n=1 Tax=Lichtheimia corymbifera JMRC:FSU:9682 TaxID=1263082 RepID=A0A068SED9_9FUNG|nr:predicted protein [Lichtheimia corymbifera JMRC:FSU:9682]